jgi:hypothetical protein
MRDIPWPCLDILRDPSEPLGLTCIRIFRVVYVIVRYIHLQCIAPDMETPPNVYHTVRPQRTLNEGKKMKNETPPLQPLSIAEF